MQNSQNKGEKPKAQVSCNDELAMTRRVIIIEDDMVIGAILDHFIESKAAGHGRRAWLIVLERLSARFGAKVVRAAERRYARELRRERRSASAAGKSGVSAATKGWLRYD